MKATELELPPLPALPPPGENLARIKDALKEDPGAMDRPGLSIMRVANSNPPWVGEGDHGWRADLRIPPAEPIRGILHELAGWWDEAVREAVRGCPEPEGGRRQEYLGRLGRPRFRRTTWWEHRAGGEILIPGCPPTPVRVESCIWWDGQARVSRITWPFNQVEINRRIIRALGDALGQALTGQWEQGGTSATRRRRTA